MIIFSRYLCDKIWQKLTFIKVLGISCYYIFILLFVYYYIIIILSFSDKEFKVFSTLRQQKTQLEDNNSKMENNNSNDSLSFVNYRFIYPEFLPDPNPLYRNSMREKLERMDMLNRRSVLNIPEFYVGSILAVTYSDLHASEKINRFVGICILREGSGLRASFLLRNVVNGEGVEVSYDLYDPAIQKIDCLK